MDELNFKLLLGYLNEKFVCIYFIMNKFIIELIYIIVVDLDVEIFLCVR